MVEKNINTGDETLKSSTLIFFRNLIDYAGLFPPAQLPLDRAIRNYAAFQTYEDAWMLGHFIIPVTQLKQLTPSVALFSESNPLTLSAIGRSSSDAESCLSFLQADLKQISLFNEKYKAAACIKGFELPLPPVVPKRDLLEVLSLETKKRNLKTFCEVTVAFNEDWNQQMLATLDEIAIQNNKHNGRLGIKLRTGGLTVEAFPAPEQVAAVIVGCSERSIPQKFTAGLHHPIRMYRNEVKTKMHGFLNVFTAGMLARTQNIDLATVAQILADENSANFTFTEQGLAWKGTVVNVSEMEHLRLNALCSFGSCSFDEPREDLRTLQMI
ncbi:hypothetical protein [Alkalihalobacillus sp. BA299]|uniref:hypothetical protein n=1 Tax=Alkalihalobacillus sp. BA299 TaxID=2815938 RepID=UPI001AD97443|nr:hypothetical protein [Alkalihalobacillus sp. BA299]